MLMTLFLLLLMWATSIESMVVVTSCLVASSVFMLMGLGSHPSSVFVIDEFSPTFVVLTTLILTLMGCMLFYPMKSPLMFSIALLLACLFSVGVFITPNMLMFYMFFEMSMIPTLIMIMNWGYQPERTSATMYLVVYTMVGSLPLLISLLMMNYHSNLNIVEFSLDLSNPGSYLEYSIIFYMFLTAFLIKTPMFLVHLWLPKAHVEAPVVGSMFLAAILLKLGSCGVMRLGIMASVHLPSLIVVSISAISFIYVSLVCLGMMDMKIIIAYSSVVHMASGLMLLGLNHPAGAGGALLVFTLHGTISASMFMVAHIMYTRSNSRVISMNKTMGFVSSLFSFYFLMFSLAMIGVPPTSGFLSEVWMILVLSVELNIWPILVLMISGLGGVMFHLYSMVYQRTSLAPTKLTAPIITMENTAMMWGVILIMAAPILALN